MPEPWRTLEERELLDCRIFRAVQVRRRSPLDGSEHTFYLMRSPDWVNVIALTADDEIVLIEQWRHGTAQAHLEIPGGIVDPDESPARAALRELEEETGYRPAELWQLGVCRPNPAFLDNRCTTFLARGCRPCAAPRPEGTEQIRIRLEPFARVPALIASGAIDHAIVLVALGYELLRRQGALVPLAVEPQPGPAARGD
ncbi:MAG: ADP-ribose pyrophosphatase [Planctomycetota bacterium]|nr:MAG: ADP-ribose pyrophosphatase [Planctomycetota bacterium]